MFVLAALVIGVGATPALAQSSPPAYAQAYESGMETASEARQLEESNIAEAASLYEEAYRQLAEASEGAQEEGNLEHSDQIRMTAAKLAYRAGQLLYDDQQLEAAMGHFEYGMDLAPSFAANRDAYNTAQAALRQGPVVEASQALNSGNPREALAVLEGAEETPNVLFYKAEAYNALNEDEQSITLAQRALEGDALSSTKRARLYLLIGEAQMRQGDQEGARTNLARAQEMGSGQVSERAAALLGQLN